MTKSFFKNKTSYTSRWIVLMIDISISLQAFFLAYLIRFNFSLKFGPHEFLQQLPLVATITLLSFLIVGSFKGVVRHTGAKDAINVFWSATLIVIILLLMNSLCWGEAANVQKRLRLAIVDFEVKGENLDVDDLGSIVAEWLITALVNLGRFDVIERGQLQKILEEQKLSVGGLVDDRNVADIWWAR